MRITLLCSDAGHPVNAWLERWCATQRTRHEVTLARRRADLAGGDILFLVSCSEILRAEDRQRYGACLVLHASDLPRGRGWSPHVWEIAGGAAELTVTLLEAADKVDSGAIWKKLRVPVPEHALWDEIHARLFDAELQLMDYAVSNFGQVAPAPQSRDIEPTYYRRRTPEDSRIDPEQSIAAQFDRIRVCDPERYPAFFELRGCRYKLVLEKLP